MYNYTEHESNLPHSLNMFVDPQGSFDGRQQQHPQREHILNDDYPSQSSTVPHETLAAPPNEDATFQSFAQNEENDKDAPKCGARRAPQSTPRPSQNRAAFGKWKSKAIPGFPPADTPLPPGITAQKVFESYPNHVNDYFILALMREGKGAKAIDALIPGPPGRQKAGQSHSKIQLRISTIREAFPNEDFPITSTKRNRAPSDVSGNGARDSTGSSSAARTANGFSSSECAIKGVLRTTEALSGVIQRQETSGFAPESRHDQFTRSSWDLARSTGSLSQTTEPPLRLGRTSPVPFSATAVSDITLPFLQPLSLEAQIKVEFQKHKQLVFAAFYSEQPLSSSEMPQTILAHCTETYDAFSRELQVKSGMLDKKVLLNGLWEHPLSYLYRCIIQCFERLPEFRARVDDNCPKDQISKRIKTAILQDLLGRLHGWTKCLEAKLEVARQIKGHSQLHARTTANFRALSAQEDWQSRASRSQEGHTAYALQSYPLSVKTSVPVLIDGKDINPLGTRAGSNSCQVDRSKASDETTESHTFEHFFPAGLDQQAPRSDNLGTIVSSASTIGRADQTMDDAPAMTPSSLRHEFETYMEEAGKFINRETRGADLPPTSGKPQTTACH